MNRRSTAALSLAGLLLGAGLLHASGLVEVSQLHRAFSIAALSVHRGDSVRFTNEDIFNHQVFVKTPNFSFESGEQTPGETINILFSKPGVFDVQCGIHPRMHLSVTVE